jgi:outer membrane protein
MDTTLKRFLVALLFLCGIQLHAQSKKWTLEECIDYAVKNNISVKLSELDERTAGVSRRDAIGAYLPTANAQASHSWNVGLNQNITTGLLENQTTQFTSLGLNVSVDIYNGLQNYNRARRANLAIISAQYQLTQIREDVALNVANAYLQILFNKENLKVQQQQLEYDNRQMQRVQELVDAGSVPRGDLMDISATVAADNQRVIVAENALLLSKLSLAQLMQLEDFHTFDIADTEYPVTESSVMLQKPTGYIQ